MSDLTRREPRRTSSRGLAAPVPTIVLAVLALLGGPALLEAQSESSRHYVTIEKAEVRGDGKDHFIDV